MYIPEYRYETLLIVLVNQTKQRLRMYVCRATPKLTFENAEVSCLIDVAQHAYRGSAAPQL